MSNLLPSPLQQPHIKAFDTVAEARMAGLPLENILVYIVDTAPESVLPFLAEQFDILGVKGYKYATTVAQKRAAIKNAIELHRFKGTPYAIGRALQNVGLTVSRIEEGVGQRTQYNSVYTYNGSRTYGSLGHWAYFRVYVDTANNGTVSATQFSEAIEIINEFKNVRSHLYDITVESGVSDTVSPIDELTFEVQHAISEGMGAFFNGAFQYNGAIQYTYISDDTNFTVL